MLRKQNINKKNSRKAKNKPFQIVFLATNPSNAQNRTNRSNNEVYQHFGEKSL